MPTANYDGEVLKSRMETHHKDDSCSAGSRGALWVLGNLLSNCMSPDKSIAEDFTFVIAWPAFHPLRDLRRHIIPGTTSEADQDWFRMRDNSCKVLDAYEDQQLSCSAKSSPQCLARNFEQRGWSSTSGSHKLLDKTRHLAFTQNMCLVETI